MHAAVLKYFDEVARQGSIRRAAQALNVASSAVNRQILKLEQELGVPLFERSADGVRLTSAGEILVRHARTTLYDFERVRADIEDLKGLKSGHLTIASLASMLVDFLPHVVSTFSRTHPSITYTIHEQRPEEVIDSVAMAAVDIGLCFIQDDNPLVRPIAEINTPLRVIVAPQHPLATRRYLSLEECTGYPVVFIYGSKLVTEAVRSELMAAAPTLVARVSTNALDMVKRAVKDNLGITFLTEIGVRRELKEGSLVAIPLVQTRLSELRVGVVVPANRQLSTVAAVFLDHVARHLDELR